MYSLDTIRSINDRAAAKALQPHIQSRDCSFCITPRGIVLHSARHRDTVYVHAGNRTYKHLVEFLPRMAFNGQQQTINNSIERYYRKFAA